MILIASCIILFIVQIASQVIQCCLTSSLPGPWNIGSLITLFIIVFDIEKFKVSTTSDPLLIGIILPSAVLYFSPLYLMNFILPQMNSM
jgi:putative effector of murein hydrolase LrgA (UPF0299 family)